MLAVISDGLSISQVASKVGVSRQTLHSRLIFLGSYGVPFVVVNSKGQPTYG